MIPGWLPSVVLVLASFRIFRVVGWDDLPPLARWRARATGMRSRTSTTEGGRIMSFDRPTLAKFIDCPYCLGFWIALAVYGLWLAWPTATLYGCAPLALSAAVGIVATKLD